MNKIKSQKCLFRKEKETKFQINVLREQLMKCRRI